MNQLDAAISDYSAALAINPKIESSLYGRGLSEFRKGDKFASMKDIAAAKAIDPGIADEFAEIGLPAPTLWDGVAKPHSFGACAALQSPSGRQQPTGVAMALR